MAGSIRIAIVGAGPAGLYAAHHLLDQRDLDIGVDIFERLPTPWGLIRAGVAPDHPDKKRIANTVFRQVLARPSLRYFGNVAIGSDITLEELRRRYNAVIVASGANGDIRLDIAGETLAGSWSAREFVGWYNGHPDHRQLDIRLDSPRAIIIGNGNVALDIARILTSPVADLQRTDIADHALAALRNSAIREVVIVGRRGARHAAFNTPELEELQQLTNVQLRVKGDDLDSVTADDSVASWNAARKVALLRAANAGTAPAGERVIELRFFSAPEAIVGDDRVTAVRLRQNTLQIDANGREAIIPTDLVETLSTGLLIRAIGYRGTPFPGLPYDAARGVIANRQGRVFDGDHGMPGVYVTGWIKRGPRGIIGTNKQCSAATVQALLADLAAGALPPAAPVDDIPALLHARGVDYVDLHRWQHIDRSEQMAGRKAGRARIKFTQVADMLGAAEWRRSP